MLRGNRSLNHVPNKLAIWVQGSLRLGTWKITLYVEKECRKLDEWIKSNVRKYAWPPLLKNKLPNIRVYWKWQLLCHCIIRLLKYSVLEKDLHYCRGKKTIGNAWKWISIPCYCLSQGDMRIMKLHIIKKKQIKQ